jgi:hypothetical protein
VPRAPSRPIGHQDVPVVSRPRKPGPAAVACVQGARTLPVLPPAPRAASSAERVRVVSSAPSSRRAECARTAAPALFLVSSGARIRRPCYGLSQLPPGRAAGSPQPELLEVPQRARTARRCTSGLHVLPRRHPALGGKALDLPLVSLAAPVAEGPASVRRLSPRPGCGRRCLEARRAQRLRELPPEASARKGETLRRVPCGPIAVGRNNQAPVLVLPRSASCAGPVVDYLPELPQGPGHWGQRSRTNALGVFVMSRAPRGHASRLPHLSRQAARHARRSRPYPVQSLSRHARRAQAQSCGLHGVPFGPRRALPQGEPMLVVSPVQVGGLLMARGAALQRTAPGLVALETEHTFVRADVHPCLELPGMPVLG